MQLVDIKIPKSFKATQPNSSKLIACANYYRKFGQLDKPITVDTNMVLVDGYVRYLVAQKMGLTEVPIKLMAHERIYVMGKHADAGKEYCWKIKIKDEKKFMERIHVGDKVIANTRKGSCPITITQILVRDTPPVEQKIKTIAKF